MSNTKSLFPELQSRASPLLSGGGWKHLQPSPVPLQTCKHAPGLPRRQVRRKRTSPRLSAHSGAHLERIFRQTAKYLIV